jgi:lysosomal alpha-mannosidase
MAFFRVALAVAVFGAVAGATACNHEDPWPYGGNNYLRVGGTLASGAKLTSRTAALVMQEDGNLVLRRKRDGKAVWESNTANTCAGASLLVTANDMQLNVVDRVSGRSNPCWQVSFQHPTEIVVVQDYCSIEAFQQAPMTNQTWVSNTPACIEVHIVPHSHDDVGWLLTPERYYDGCYALGGGVRGILDTVVQQLASNPDQTYNQVESYYFHRWWSEQNDTTKATVRQLAQNGQLAFLNGGWSMHDEACVHQESAISNMEVGARFLKEELGVEMNIGWHVDPFGHASATPKYMAEMGFDAFFFWRVDYQQRQFQLDTRQMETVWDNSPSRGDKTLMFTSIQWQSYCIGCWPTQYNACPSQFFSMSCENTDDPQLQNVSPALKILGRESKPKQSKLGHIHRQFGFSGLSNESTRLPPTLEDIAQNYAQLVQSYAPGFRHGIVLIPWGCDFEHVNAGEDYALMDQIIENINGNYSTYGIDIFYSTAPRYITAVKAMNYQWPVNKHDYFVYSMGPHAYLSGFLSSRAEYKGYERFLMNERSGVDIAISAISPTAINLTTQLARAEDMRQALGVAQHHDSITGTERTPVRNQYQFLLNRGFDNISLALSDAIHAAVGVAAMPCKLANLSYCPLTDDLALDHPVSVYLYNPLAQARTEMITIPVPVNTLEAYLMPWNTPVPIQVVTTWALTTTTDNTSPAVPSHSPYQAYMEVTMAPMSLVEVKLVVNKTATASVKETQLSGESATVISNEFYAVTFDQWTNRATSVTNYKTGLTSTIDQNVGHYCPYPALPNEQPAGAYIMRTCDPEGPLYPYTLNFSSSTLVAGPLCTELRQVIDVDSNIQQAFRLCRGQDYVEIQTGVGEVRTLGTGVEVIMSLATDVQSQGVWYTDSQALEMQQRVRNTRPNYPYTLTEPIASNFFPCNAFTFLNSTNASSPKNVVVITDRSRGTASINDGELQFIVQRRLVFDDNLGVEEALDEHTRVLTTSRVVFNTDELYTSMRLHGLRHTHRPLVRYGSPSAARGPPKHFNSRVRDDLLPANVHLHTRTIHAPGEMILRLQHLFAVGEGPLAEPVILNITSVLPEWMKVLSVTDMDMNTVKVAATMNRIPWPVCDGDNLRTVPAASMGGSQPLINATSTASITLEPMEFRVLKIEYTY